MTLTVPVTILYHADCPDGFGAAYAAWLRFGDAACYRPMHHGEPWDMAEIAGHDVYVLDFSFPPEQLETIACAAHTTLQIDHHASARKPWADRLKDTPGGSARHEHPELPLTVEFDLDKSGVRLAWEHFHPGTPLPLVLRHVEDIDLWRFAIPGSRPVGRALRLLPYDFSTWDSLVRAATDADAPRYRTLLAEGEAIESFFQTEVDRLAGGALVMPTRLRGEAIDPLQAIRHGLAVITEGEQAWRAIDGLAINANALFASEVGGRLAERSGSFSLVWYLAADGEVKCSLRGNGSVDVSEIAANYGGGGHPNAAGFRLPWSRFFAEILEQTIK